MITKPLTDLWFSLKQKWLVPGTREYTREYMREKRKTNIIQLLHNRRTREYFNEDDLRYIKLIAIK